jgi:anti-sigma regulatory factor (Ser/Thr protein kinase)
MTLPDQAGGTWLIGPLDAESELIELRAACRRQSQVINGLGQRCATLRRGAMALEDQNAALRAELERLRGNVVGGAPPTRGRPAPERGEIVLPAAPRAAGAARIVLRQWLRGHAPSSVVDDAVLVASELVANSVRHADLTPEDVIRLGIELASDRVRIEVEDPGSTGAVAPRRPDFANGGGFGLNVVLALSARWGVVRGRTTRVWAELTWSSPPGAGKGRRAWRVSP